MFQQTVSPYEFHRETEALHRKSSMDAAFGVKAAVSHRKVEKKEASNQKRNARRRVEKVRSLVLVGVESDTGSDGMAVNSEGSGRSGDWSLPKIRTKSNSYRKRQENRTSLTDSGISLSKLDTDMLSEFRTEYSLDGYQRVLLRPHIQEKMKIQHTYKEAEHADRNPIVLAYSPPTQACSFGKYEGTTTDIATNENNAVEKKAGNIEQKEKKAGNIEQKEKAILEQCFKNEDPKSGDSNYVVDCSLLPQSRFPLPDHLNYPINRYRTKLEHNRIQPLKKLKASWKKFKSRKLFNIKKDNLSPEDQYPEINYPEFYPGFSNGIKNDNDEILSRLSRDPNERRSFAKRVFGRFGSRSFSIHVSPDHFECRNRLHAKGLTRSTSTRSVPEALQDMWNKTHFSDCSDDANSTSERTMKKVASMPTIHGHFDSKIDATNSLEYRNNYFSQFVNRKGIIARPTDTVDSAYGTNLSASLSNLHLGEPDALASEQTPTDKLSGINTASELPHVGCENEETRNQGEKLNLQKSKKYSSCHELYQKTEVVVPHVPQVMVPHGVCVCCTQGQFIPYMQVPFYHYPNFVYHPPPYDAFQPFPFNPNAYYPNNNVQFYYPYGPNTEQLKGVSRQDDDIVAPLPVKVDQERKAEKRIISEMTFDTFV